MARIRQIFWDNDGIFVETEPLYFEATRRILAEVDVDLDLDAYRELLLNQARGAWFMAEEKGCDAATIAAMVERRNHLYGELILAQAEINPAAEQVVASLAGSYAMAIVTSSRQEHFELIHRQGRITRHMDFVLWAGMYPRSKPDPAPYLSAIQRSVWSAQEAVVIEDSLRGLRAAHAAGLRCWVIPTELTKSQDFSLAERVLDSIEQVPDALSTYR